MGAQQPAVLPQHQLWQRPAPTLQAAAAVGGAPAWPPAAESPNAPDSVATVSQYSLLGPSFRIAPPKHSPPHQAPPSPPELQGSAPQQHLSPPTPGQSLALPSQHSPYQPRMPPLPLPSARPSGATPQGAPRPVEEQRTSTQCYDQHHHHRQQQRRHDQPQPQRLSSLAVPLGGPLFQQPEMWQAPQPALSFLDPPAPQLPTQGAQAASQGQLPPSPPLACLLPPGLQPAGQGQLPSVPPAPLSLLPPLPLPLLSPSQEAAQLLQQAEAQREELWGLLDRVMAAKEGRAREAERLLWDARYEVRWRHALHAELRWAVCAVLHGTLDKTRPLRPRLPC
jgi:hypothetical protein